MTTISFTGHRPDKLGGYNWNTPFNQAIMNKLKFVVLKEINNINETDIKFISGMALGIDQMAFDIVLFLKQFIKDKNITLESAIPFKDQPNNWVDKKDIERYYNQLSKADIITYVDTLDNYKIKGYKEDIYYFEKMQKRNEYMVDKSDIIIAFWDGSKGGTYNCVQYAKKQNKRLIIINPKEII